MKKALGKGLGALIGEQEVQSTYQGIVHLKINEIEPNRNQPRKSFNDEKIVELAKSIVKHGVVQPIIVKKSDEYYSIIAGERRWRASRIAGLKEIPCIIKDYNEKEVMQIALIENIQREDLNPIEESSAYERLISEHHITHDELAEMVGKSRPYLTNSIRLLNLSKDIQEMLIDGRLSVGHARCLLSIKEVNTQVKMANEVVDKNLSVRQTEQFVKVYDSKKVLKHGKMRSITPEIYDIQVRLQDVFGTKVEIENKKNKGKITIEYYSDDELDRILNLVNKLKVCDEYIN